mmetsp:Transcript_15503/g.31617  ORF Transcript_15503/g.31617 Transcript_15503/m.31617 type:complete len:490 (+) Transcript_15503:92-1561(+)
MSAPKSVAVGVDVSPGFSRLCTASLVYKSGLPSVTPSVISNALGFRSTPTVVAPDESDADAFIVGEAAKKALTRVGANGENKGEVLESANVLAKMKGGDDKDALTFFAHLKELAAEASGVGMKASDRLKCVLAVPATSTQSSVDGLVAAAGAGFNKPTSIVAAITRPAAICVAHGLTGGHAPAAPPSWSVALAVDWDYTGLTATVVRRVGSSGLLQLGDTVEDKTVTSQTLVDAMMAHCATQFKRKSGLDVWESKKAIAKLRPACETAVRTLGKGAKADVEVDGLMDGVDLRVPVSKPRWDMLIGSAVGKGKALLEGIKGSGVEIDTVLLSGDVCEMPSVKAMVAGLFEGAWMGSPAVPCDEAVVIGCAIHACFLVEGMVYDSVGKGLTANVSVAEGVTLGLATLDEEGNIQGDSVKTVIAGKAVAGVEVEGVLSGVKKGASAAVVDVNGGNKVIVKIGDCDEGDLRVGLKLGLEGGLVVRVGATEIAC